ncbi:MAG TPA: trypsin-like peptidase domain-containing protein [Solirubrobacteraceae bacterium]|jgi:S1-C subfamily serine protease|nr:trypsin-like peptidase domain-containing protein [Solirubrobacteraceae bacterium]
MSTPTIEQPPAGPGNGRLADPPTPPGGPRRRRSGGGAGRALLVVVALGAALLGAGAVAGLLAVTGALDGSTKSTSVVQQVSGSGGSGATSGLNARKLYASSSAGVVDITAQGVSSPGGQGGGGPFGAPGGQSQTTAAGSGSVLDGQGRILTAAHVVTGASSIKVSFQDGTTRTARVLGSDPSTDIALLKIDPSGLTLHPLALGSSKTLSVGDPLAVIGDPFQYSRSLSTGVVSGVDRTIGATNGFSIAHAIQTDASLNPGNSGGPVLDANGRLVGIADQIATGGTASSSSGVGFAVPIDLVKSELSQLERGAQVNHAFLGVETGQTADGKGALIGSVQGGGPAAAAGLRSGDVVTAFDGNPVQGSNDLVAAISGHQAGDRVKLTVRRGSSTQVVTVTLAAQPRQAASTG